MKIDRLIGILSVLLQEEQTTAPKLAERFEVSRRTINRDIEDLCKAGIPIKTVQGTGGGISIMDGYRMDSITHVASYEGNREVPMPDLSSEKVFPAKDRVKALFDPSMKWQLVEEYGVDSFTEQDDGSLLFEHEYADDEGLLSWMLSCRDKVTVLEPERIRERLCQITTEIARRYAAKY